MRKAEQYRMLGGFEKWGCGECRGSSAIHESGVIRRGAAPFAPFLAVLFFGSLWGFAEATAGAMLHLSGFVYKGALMANVGFFVMAAAASSVALPAKKPWLLAGVGLVAALFKVMDAFILSVPLWERMIVNPAVSIILEALAFAGILSLAARPSRARGDGVSRSLAAAVRGSAAPLPLIVLSGLTGMFAATAAVACVFFFVLGRGPARVASLHELIRYIAVQGGVASLFASVSAAAGALVGNVVRTEGSKTTPARGPSGMHPGAVLTAAAVALIVAFWAAAAWFRVSGIGG